MTRNKPTLSPSRLQFNNLKKKAWDEYMRIYHRDEDAHDYEFVVSPAQLELLKFIHPLTTAVFDMTVVVEDGAKGFARKKGAT